MKVSNILYQQKCFEEQILYVFMKKNPTKNFTTRHLQSRSMRICDQMLSKAQLHRFYLDIIVVLRSEFEVSLYGSFLKQIFWIIENQQQLWKVMEAKMIIKEVRIYFQNKVTTNKELSMKVSIGDNIVNINPLTLNRFCKRWESEEKIELNILQNQEIRIQILKHKTQSAKKIVGRGKIDILSFPQAFSEELKVVIIPLQQCLTTKGQVVGWLYCQFSKNLQVKQKKQHFLNMHRLTASFLDMRDEDCSITIYLNDCLVFMREIQLRVRKRSLFPNIKIKVKKSDLLVFEINSKRQKGNQNLFLIEKLQSGQTSILKSWMRNNLGNKMGDLEFEYFLQNFYLPNQRPHFTPAEKNKGNESLQQERLTKKQQQDLRMSISIENLARVGHGKTQMNNNALLRRAIHGERRRKNLVYLPSNLNKGKSSFEMDLIIEDNTQF